MLNVDTHVLIDALRGEPRPRERRLLAADRWSVAAIVIAATSVVHGVPLLTRDARIRRSKIVPLA